MTDREKLDRLRQVVVKKATDAITETVLAKRKVYKTFAEQHIDLRRFIYAANEASTSIGELEEAIQKIKTISTTQFNLSSSLTEQDVLDAIRESINSYALISDEAMRGEAARWLTLVTNEIGKTMKRLEEPSG